MMCLHASTTTADKIYQYKINKYNILYQKQQTVALIQTQFTHACPLEATFGNEFANF